MLRYEQTGPCLYQALSCLVLFYSQSHLTWLSPWDGESFLICSQPILLPHIPDPAGTRCLGGRRQGVVSRGFQNPVSIPVLGVRGEAGGLILALCTALSSQWQGFEAIPHQRRWRFRSSNSHFYWEFYWLIQISEPIFINTKNFKVSSNKMRLLVCSYSFSFPPISQVLQK